MLEFKAWCVIISRAIGANFCQVDKIKHVIKLSPWSTSGIQRWNGAIPSFMASAIVSIIEGRWVCILIIVHSPVNHALIVDENKIRADADAWIKKYLVAASIARGWWSFVISGMIASVLISRPIQARNQWLLINVSVVPMERLDNKIDNA